MKRAAWAISAALTLAGALPLSPAQSQSMIVTHQPEMPDPSRGKQGIEHTPLLRTDVADATGQEVIVWDTEYAPRAINPRHYHPAAITFYIVSGSGVWQEDGREP